MTAPLAPFSESTLTDRYQTTVPAPVRKVLGLSKSDKIHYTIHSDGQVVISRADRSETKDDPVLVKFLDFLARDMEKNPHHVQSINPNLIKRAQSLAAGIEFDIDAPLADDQE
jgi:antitoxin PrlF